MIFLAGCCVVKNNKVLLVQQTEKGDQANRWGPPAGHAEKNESFIECAKRETFEETGLKVKIIGLVQAGVAKYKDSDYCLVLYYAKLNKDSKIKPQQEEVQSFVWANLGDLKKNKFLLRKMFLKEPLILSLTQKPSPIDIFKLIDIEKN